MCPPQELVESALRILVAWSNGRKPAPGDVALLRDAFPALDHVPDDDLAVQVVHDLSSRVFPKSEQKLDSNIVKHVA